VDLSEIVKEFAGAAKTDPSLIVGFETGDDAGVYRLTDDIALVQTVDYITPVVDDPYLFGQVAAANSISDVYAMGGRPLTAMNCCNFPARNIDTSALRRILEGGFSKIREAGATLVGGHTVRDDELKYGLSVTGIIDPKRVLTNAGARPGDSLVLTKPIGTGVIITGHRRGLVSDGTLETAVGWMSALNRVACETMLQFDAHACTDITGFGLSGHVLGVAKASGVRIRIRFADLPRYDESLELIAQGVGTAVTASNLQVVQDRLTFSGFFTDEEKTLVVDPQTSGGLFVSLPPDEAREMVKRLRAAGNTAAAVIGEVLPGEGRPGLEYVKSSER
jgi:selenide,water dikinase